MLIEEGTRDQRSAVSTQSRPSRKGSVGSAAAATPSDETSDSVSTAAAASVVVSAAAAPDRSFTS